MSGFDFEIPSWQLDAAHTLKITDVVFGSTATEPQDGRAQKQQHTKPTNQQQALDRSPHSFRAVPHSPRCRTASKSVMIVAIATLSESAWPAMGMRMRASASFSQKSLSPYCSLPMSSATEPLRSAFV